MELSPSWEVNSCSATQETPSIVWNPEAHYHVNKGLPLVSILSQMNPVHIPQSYFSKVNFYIISHLQLGLSYGLFPSGFHIKTECTPHLPQACYIPAHLTLLDLIILIIFGEEYNLWSSSLCNFSSQLSLHPQKMRKICRD
jgi:hypothetical protein